MKRAAEDLGIDRSTLHVRIQKTPRLQAVKAETEEELKDEAEGGLRELVLAKDPAMIRFYLVQKAKDRGFGKLSVDDDQLDAILGGMSEAGLKALAEDG